jgi:hypothetical protein
MTSPERQLEEELVEKLRGLKYEHRADIRDREALEKNFREKFQALNHVKLTDAEFQRLLEEIITPDVFTAARILREMNSFSRDDGTPLNYTLVNIKDWCKNNFEVVNQLRINTDNSHHRYDVLLLINGVPVVQIELRSHLSGLSIASPSARRCVVFNDRKLQSNAETSLVNGEYPRHIREWPSEGYHVSLLFLSVSNGETAIARVLGSASDKRACHWRPVIRKRFAGGLSNVDSAYKLAIDAWTRFDNDVE